MLRNTLSPATTIILLISLATASAAKWNFVPPPDSGVINVKDYGAKGDGIADDTNAIRRAIAENIDARRYRANPMFYFPNGTYLVTGPIESRNGNTGFSAGWRSMAVLIGESRDGTVIKLKDKAPGYGNPKKPKWVVAFGSESNNKKNFSGGGNRAFRHGLINMTIDVGNGNPGAIGVDFIASNRGTIDNVTIRSGARSGHTGIAMTRNWPGPAMVIDTRIEGFARGMTLGHYQYGMTFENVEMVGQRVVGIQNANNVLTMRHVNFQGNVPFYNAPKGRHNMLCLLDSHISGTGTANHAAITTAGLLNLRRVKFSGYGTIVKDTSRSPNDLVAPSLEEETVHVYDKGFKINANGGTPEPLDLPIEDIPVIRAPDDAVWVDGGKTYESLQGAIDAGAEYIYITPIEPVRLTETIVLRNKVKLIFGLNGHIIRPDGKPAIIVEDGTSDIIQLEHIYVDGDIIHNSNRTFVLRHGDRADLDGKAGVFYGKGPGKTHIIDVIGRDYRISGGHRLWARQMNAEFGTKPLFTNDGGTSWILGFKMESSPADLRKGIKGTPSILNSFGGQLELFGGLLYTLGSKKSQRPTVPAFTNKGGSIAISYRTNGVPDTYYTKILATNQSDNAIKASQVKGPGAALLTDKQ